MRVGPSESGCRTRFQWKANKTELSMTDRHATCESGQTGANFETVAALPGGFGMVHAIGLGIEPFAELGANSESWSGSRVDSPCSCRAILKSAPVTLLQSRNWRRDVRKEGGIAGNLPMGHSIRGSQEP